MAGGLSVGAGGPASLEQPRMNSEPLPAITQAAEKIRRRTFILNMASKPMR